MASVVRVADAPGGVFLHPTVIFAALEPEAREMAWTILDLGEAFAPDGSDLDVLALERQVADSTTGLHLSFAGLQALVAGLQQVIDGLFLGVDPGHEFPPRDSSDGRLIAEAQVVVAALDSSFWLISAPDEMLDRVRARFHDVTDVAPVDVVLSTWGR